MNLMYHHQVEFSAPVFGVLILALIPISSSYIFGTLLTANGSLKYLNIMALSGMVVNVSLNLILIPKYQAYGSAIASIFTQAVVALIQIVLSYKLFNLRLNVRLILKFTVFIGFVVLAATFINDLPIMWAFQAVVLLVVGIIFSLSIRLFTVKGLIRILKYKKE
jgi:O-antigen/teichoic acid export membrane protein